MKKTIFIIALFVALVATSQSWAQESGKIRLGAGLAFGSDAAINSSGNGKFGTGINFNGEYFFTDAISGAPGYTFFFKSTQTVGGEVLSYKLSSFNIDGKYFFLTEAVNVYGLLGISFSKATVTGFVFTIPFNVSVNETGLNIGGGVDYPLSDAFYLNGQLKYNTAFDGQFVINLGVGYTIN